MTLSAWTESMRGSTPRGHTPTTPTPAPTHGDMPSDNDASRSNVDVHLKATTKTKLDGRLSMLVDLGSRINLIGDRARNEDFARVLEQYGLEIP